MHKIFTLSLILLLTGCAGGRFGTFGEGAQTGDESAVSGGAVYEYSHTWRDADGIEHKCEASSTSGRNINGAQLAITDSCGFSVGVNSASGTAETVNLIREVLPLLQSVAK